MEAFGANNYIDDRALTFDGTFPSLDAYVQAMEQEVKDLAIAVVMIFVMFVILIVLRYRDTADDNDPTACRSMQVHPPGKPWRYGMRVAM